MTDKEEKLLRDRWRAKRRRMCDEWRNDYTAFRAWCVARGWTPSMWIVASGPVLGPGTADLRQTAPNGPPLEDYKPVPGYSHRPCLTCGVKEERCTNVCWKYEIHLDATLARAREIAKQPAKRRRRA